MGRSGRLGSPGEAEQSPTDPPLAPMLRVRERARHGWCLRKGRRDSGHQVPPGFGVEKAWSWGPDAGQGEPEAWLCSRPSKRGMPSGHYHPLFRMEASPPPPEADSKYLLGGRYFVIKARVDRRVEFSLSLSLAQRWTVLISSPVSIMARYFQHCYYQRFLRIKASILVLFLYIFTTGKLVLNSQPFPPLRAASPDTLTALRGPRVPGWSVREKGQGGCLPI